MVRQRQGRQPIFPTTRVFVLANAGHTRREANRFTITKGKPMPSFDVVSQVDQQELRNAVDQANREIGNRFDFKGSNARIEMNDYELKFHAPAEFQIGQIRDVLDNKLGKRKIDIGCLVAGEIVEAGNEAHQTVTVRHGIDKDLARGIVKQIKDSKLKVQAAIQGEQVRITGKKRDDLQQAITKLKGGDFEQPLQYINFRD